MNLDLSKLLDKTIHKISFSEELNVDNSLLGDSTLTIKNPAKVTGTIFNTDEGIFLDAEITFIYDEICARCSKRINKEGEAALHGKIIDKAKLQKVIDDPEELYISYDGNKIDLLEPVVTTILLSLPMKSLCSTSCKGICPKCGMDLNTSQCKCIEDNIDPRLAKLKELFE